MRQVDVSHASGVSLATISSLELGRSSFKSTISLVLQALHQRAELAPEDIGELARVMRVEPAAISNLLNELRPPKRRVLTPSSGRVPVTLTDRLSQLRELVPDEVLERMLDSLLDFVHSSRAPQLNVVEDHETEGHVVRTYRPSTPPPKSSPSRKRAAGA